VIGAALSYTEAIGDLSEDFPGGPGPLFLPLTWTAVLCILIAVLVEFFEHGLQKFTPPGEIIAVKWRPADVQWISYNTKALARSVRHDASMAQNSIGNQLGAAGF
jgi:hypothetical protein